MPMEAETLEIVDEIITRGDAVEQSANARSPFRAGNVVWFAGHWAGAEASESIPELTDKRKKAE